MRHPEIRLLPAELRAAAGPASPSSKDVLVESRLKEKDPPARPLASCPFRCFPPTREERRQTSAGGQQQGNGGALKAQAKEPELCSRSNQNANCLSSSDGHKSQPAPLQALYPGSGRPGTAARHADPPRPPWPTLPGRSSQSHGRERSSATPEIIQPEVLKAESGPFHRGRRRIHRLSSNLDVTES